MWKVFVDDIWGYEDNLWKVVSDDALEDMRAFLRAHVKGCPTDYHVERGEGIINITMKSTGNFVLALRRAN